MSNEINHEGNTYILKSHVEGIIKERVSKVANRASDAEKQLLEMQGHLSSFEKRAASLDIMAQQLETLKGQLSQSESKFTRYQSISKYGITEPDLIDTIEYQYKKSMDKLPKKDHVDLDNWLGHQINNPQEASHTLRPHLESLSQQDSINVESKEASIPQSSVPDRRATAPISIRSNTGAIRPPEPEDPIQKGISDLDYFRDNEDLILQTFNKLYGNTKR